MYFDMHIYIYIYHIYLYIIYSLSYISQRIFTCFGTVNLPAARPQSPLPGPACPWGPWSSSAVSGCCPRPVGKSGRLDDWMMTPPWQNGNLQLCIYIYILSHIGLIKKNNKMEDYKGYLEVHHGLPSSQTWLGTPPFQQLGWGLKNVDPSPHDQNHRRPSQSHERKCVILVKQ